MLTFRHRSNHYACYYERCEDWRMAVREWRGKKKARELGDLGLVIVLAGISALILNFGEVHAVSSSVYYFFERCIGDILLRCLLYVRL